jgi:hypothetical protein
MNNGQFGLLSSISLLTAAAPRVIQMTLRLLL